MDVDRELPPETKRIGILLDADAANVGVAQQLLHDFHHLTLTAFGTVDALYEQLLSCMSRVFGSEDLALDVKMQAIADRLRMAPEELLKALRGDLDASGIDEARSLWESNVRPQKKVVLLLMARYFRWACTDLLRFRTVSVLGFARLQAEALALLCLFGQSPPLAREWMESTLSPEQGRRFFSRTQPQVKEIVKAHGLSTAYESGSSAAQHVRMPSAIGGLVISDEGWRLIDQEVQTNAPEDYIRRAIWFLTVQVKVLQALGTCLPELLSCESWVASRNDFGRTVTALWKELELRYPLEDTPGGESEFRDSVGD